MAHLVKGLVGNVQWRLPVYHRPHIFCSHDLAMPSDIASQTQDQQTIYINAIVGAAIFDLSGLPKDYFTTDENKDISWVQTIFQALGLRSLITSSLQVDGFRHAVIHGEAYCAIVMKQRVQYVALLVPRDDFDQLSDSLMQWAQEFEPGVLISNPRFNSA